MNTCLLFLRFSLVVTKTGINIIQNIIKFNVYVLSVVLYFTVEINLSSTHLNI